MSVQPLPILQAAALETKSATESWLVHELWSQRAVGFVAGHPKAGKSFMVLDLAVSVASGTPCLGHFPVEEKGPALVYLAEDTLPCVRQRIAALCTHRSLPIESLPLYVITAASLRLDDATDQARLCATVAALRPRLLVLDPLVRLHRCDENRADEVSALLGFLRTLQRQYQVAIVVVHHLSKKHRRDLGQSLRGSGDLHAWSNSSAYLVRRNDQIVVTLEHRSEKAPAPLTLTLASRSAAGGCAMSGAQGDFRLIVRVENPAVLPRADVVETIAIGSAQRDCVRYQVRNISLLTPTPDQTVGREERAAGMNNIYVYFAQGPDGQLEAPGIYSTALLRVRYNPPARREPSDAEIVLGQEDFVVLGGR